MPALKGASRFSRVTLVMAVASVSLLCFLLILFGLIGKQRRHQGDAVSVQNRVPGRMIASHQPTLYVAPPVSRPVERANERVKVEVKGDKEREDSTVAPSEPPLASKSIGLNPSGPIRPVEEYRLNDDMIKSLQRPALADLAVEPTRAASASSVTRIGSMAMPAVAPRQNVVNQVVLQESVPIKRSDEESSVKRPTSQAEEKPEPKASEPKASEPKASEPKASETKASETETIGVPPPKEQPQFLRNDSILMEPGDYQWEIGLSYARNLNQSPVGQFLGETAIVGNLRRVNRVLQMPIELRLGLTPDLQGSISMPIGLANQEVSIGGAELTDDSFGIGDLSLGLTRLIRQGDLTEPNVLGFLSISIPTGQASLATSLDDPSIALGRGFYTLTTGLTFTRTFDPLVFFSGFGYQHNFEANFEGVGRLNPGNGGFYRLGVGYAVNSNVSLSTAFTGAFLANAEINDIRLGGTSREPLSLRIAATVVRKQKSVKKARTIEPFVNLGLNEDATDTVLGVSWTY